MAKTLDYDFTDPQFDGTTGIEAQTGPTLTVTRASDATVMDYFNVLKTVNDNEPRFTGGRRVENLLKQSSGFDTTWTNVRSTETSGKTDPNSGTDAWSLNEDGTSANSHYMTQLYTVPKVGSYTYSVYAKASNRAFVRLNVSSVNARADFNLTTGAVGTTSGTDSESITDAGSGWYRCAITFTHTATPLANYSIWACEADNDTNFDGLSQESILIYGAQLEDVTGQDDPAPSEYIATTTAAKAQWYATKRRTNLVVQSQDFDTTWTNTGTVITPDADTAPDGTSTATTIEDNNAAGYEDVRTDAYTVQGAGTETFTASVYIKQDAVAPATRYSILRLSVGTIHYDLCIDTSTGNTNMRSAGGTPDDSGSEAAANGYYRYWVTVTHGDVSQTTLTIKLFPAGGANADLNTLSSAATGTITAWGAQLERGDTATAYIATTTTVASSDFDTAITPTGLLIEEARTNVCTYSEDMSNWSSTGATIDTDAATSPDGITTADRLNISATTDLHHTFESTGTTTTNTDHAISVFLKDDGVQYAVVNWGDATGNDHISACYDLVGQTVTDTDVGSTSGTIAATGIEDVGNGWLRCWIAGKVTPTATFLLVSGSDSATPAWNAYGSVTAWLGVEGEDLLIWGAQCEAGTFPTSYIPTVATSVTRAKDNISTADVSWFNSVGSTWYAHFSYFDNDPYNQRIFNISSGAWINQFALLLQSDGDISSLGTFATVTEINTRNNSNIPANTLARVAAGMADDDYAVIVDGGAAQTDSTLTVPTSFNAFYIGQYYTKALTLNGHIARIVYYNERLADSVLEDLSNGTFPVAASTGVSFSRNLARDLASNLARNLAS